MHEDIIIGQSCERSVGDSTRGVPIDNEEGTAEDIRKFVHVQLHHNRDVADMVDVVAKAAQTLFGCAAALCRELTVTRRPASTSKRRDFIRRLREGPVMSSVFFSLPTYFGANSRAQPLGSRFRFLVEK
jgi:hypothetical protein